MPEKYKAFDNEITKNWLFVTPMRQSESVAHPPQHTRHWRTAIQVRMHVNQPMESANAKRK